MDFIEVDGYKNHTKAEDKLTERGSLIVNSEACATLFPRTWTTNSLKKHIEIARLVKSFESLYNDWTHCESYKAKQLLEEEMNKIRETLIYKYFVVTADEMIPDFETRQRYEERQKKGRKK